MKLYHYSSEKYSVLKTKAAQEGIGSDEEKISLKNLPYNKHVSFFAEVPPFDLFESIYGTEHPFWKPGKTIYEHVVDLQDLPKDFFYMFVESKEVTELYYDPASDHLSNEEYVKRKIEILTKHQYYGTKLQDLRSVIMRSQGEVRLSYANLPKRPNFSDIKEKYAPTVPHFMIYSNTGVFKVSKVSKVVIPKGAIYKKW